MENAQFILNFLADDDEEKTENKPSKVPENERTKRKKKKNDEINILNIQKLQITDSQDNKILLAQSKEEIQINANLLTPVHSNKIDYNFHSDNVLPMKKWDEELYYGKIEYKLKLINKSKERIQGLITQMKFRLREGNGTCFYEIGLEDNGNPLGLNEEELKLSLDTLHYMTEEIGANMSIMNYFQGNEGLIAEIMITSSKIKEHEMQLQPEVKIGLIGEEGSGKSTLIGCLISDKKDNGKGMTRVNVFRHKHEIICGKTSSISHQIVGFDEKGKVTNINAYGGRNDWAEIVEKSVKIINFLDMGGSEKSLKTTVKALSKNYLDYIFLVIPANKGITNTTSDFLKIALSMGLPIVTIFTKIDMINEDDLGDLLNNFKHILKSEKKGKNPLIVSNKDDIVKFSRNIKEGILPVFLISNKKALGLDLFLNFLNLIPADLKHDIYENLESKKNIELSNETQYDILEILQVENKCILIGIVARGILLKGSQYKLGPDSNGNFKNVQLVSIHCKKIEVKSATQGQFCSILLDDSVTKDCLRSGIVVLNHNSKLNSTRAFEAEVWSIDGKERKIKFSTQPIMHISPVRQSVKIFSSFDDIKGEIKFTCEEEEFEISPNKSTKLYFEFMYSSEFIREGSHLIIYENNFKIYGYVTKLIK